MTQRWNIVEDPQQALFDLDEHDVVMREWQGMPEFVQNDEKCYATITVRFTSKEDLDRFADLVGQKLNSQSTRIWYPKLDYGKGYTDGKMYVDAEALGETI